MHPHHVMRQCANRTSPHFALGRLPDHSPPGNQRHEQAHVGIRQARRAALPRHVPRHGGRRPRSARYCLPRLRFVHPSSLRSAVLFPSNLLLVHLLGASCPSYPCSAAASLIHACSFASYLSPLRPLPIAPTIHIPPSLPVIQVLSLSVGNILTSPNSNLQSNYQKHLEAHIC